MWSVDVKTVFSLSLNEKIWSKVSTRIRFIVVVFVYIKDPVYQSRRFHFPKTTVSRNRKETFNGDQWEGLYTRPVLLYTIV